MLTIPVTENQKSNQKQKKTQLISITLKEQVIYTKTTISLHTSRSPVWQTPLPTGMKENHLLHICTFYIQAPTANNTSTIPHHANMIRHHDLPSLSSPAVPSTRLAQHAASALIPVASIQDSSIFDAPLVSPQLPEHVEKI